MIQQPILIVSPPRSGSSLCGYILDRAGIWGGKMKVGDDKYPVKYNPYGYFENIAITEVLVDYLKKNDTANLEKRFQPVNLDADDPEFYKKITKCLEGKDDNQKWFYKNVKNAFCWRLWDKYFPDATWLIVKRNREDILRSIKKTSFMDAYSLVAEWELYLDKIYSLIKMICTARRFFILDIDKVMRGELWELKLILELMEIKYSDNLLECIDKKYWNRK